jgi:sugar lactone lactonase YvrE
MKQTFFASSAIALALLVAGCSAGSSSLSAVRGIPAIRHAAAGTPVDSILFVANYHDVSFYDTISGVSEGSLTTGIIFPVGMAFDASGNLFVGNTAGGINDAGTITEFASNSSVPIRTIKKGVNDPFYLATDAAGNVYSANQFGNTITVYAPGATKPTRTISDGVQVPIFVLVDAQNNVYVANSASVTVYASGSDAPSRTITKGVKIPFSLALDSKGNLFVANYLGHSVTEYAPGGTTPIRTLDKGTTPTSIAIDSKNDLYVAGYGKRGVNEYSPSGKLMRTLKDGINYPHSVGIAPGGQVVVTNYGTGNEYGSITTYGPTGTKKLHEITDGVASPLNMAFTVPHISIGS